MEYKRFSKVRGEVRASFDEIEDWMAKVFGDSDAAANVEDDDDELDLAVAKRRRGMRYFAAGRVKDRRMFASILFPMFQGDPHEGAYREAVEDILRVAGGSVQPKTRHKLSFDLGVLYFTADTRGHMFGVVASDDFPMSETFNFLEEMLDVYDGIDIAKGLDKTDASLFQEPRFRNDAFGVQELALEAWRRLSRPEDGFSHEVEKDLIVGGTPMTFQC